MFLKKKKVNCIQKVNWMPRCRWSQHGKRSSQLWQMSQQVGNRTKVQNLLTKSGSLGLGVCDRPGASWRHRRPVPPPAPCPRLCHRELLTKRVWVWGVCDRPGASWRHRRPVPPPAPCPRLCHRELLTKRVWVWGVCDRPGASWRHRRLVPPPAPCPRLCHRELLTKRVWVWGVCDRPAPSSAPTSPVPTSVSQRTVD